MKYLLLKNNLNVYINQLRDPIKYWFTVDL